MHSGHKRKPTNPAGNGTKPPAKKQATSSSTATGHKWGEKGDQYIKGRWTKEESNKLKATIIEYARVNKIDVAILAQRKVKNARSGDENTSKQDWLSIANQSGITNRTVSYYLKKNTTKEKKYCAGIFLFLWSWYRLILLAWFLLLSSLIYYQHYFHNTLNLIHNLPFFVVFLFLIF